MRFRIANSPPIAVLGRRPLGASPFLGRLEALTRRDPRPQKRGGKPRLEAEDAG